MGRFNYLFCVCFNCRTALYFKSIFDVNFRNYDQFILEPMTEPKSDTYRGWLFKWTNYIKGIWFETITRYINSKMRISCLRSSSRLSMSRCLLPGPFKTDLKGYQRRWFVLANGYLSYYRSQQEMSHTCRGKNPSSESQSTKKSSKKSLTSPIYIWF